MVMNCLIHIVFTGNTSNGLIYKTKKSKIDINKLNMLMCTCFIIQKNQII